MKIHEIGKTQPVRWTARSLAGSLGIQYQDAGALLRIFRAMDLVTPAELVAGGAGGRRTMAYSPVDGYLQMLGEHLTKASLAPEEAKRSVYDELADVHASFKKMLDET